MLRHTTIRAVPGLEDVRLHLADDIVTVWRATQLDRRDPEAPLPYWAAAWGGGLAIGRYLLDHPAAAAGRRVFDVGAGSGICAIVAMRAGAATATASDIDPYAAAAIERNARANRVRVDVVQRDVLDEAPPDVDLVVAGDCSYEPGLAARVMPWLRAARARGIDVLVGDPGRRYLVTEDLVELARYDVRTTTELEDRAGGRVYALRAPGTPTPGRRPVGPG